MPHNVNKGILCRRILEYHQKNLRRISQQHIDLNPFSPDNLAFSPNTHEFQFHSTPIKQQSIKSISPSISSPSSFQFSNFDFIFSIGDDRTDEFMFETLNQMESQAESLHHSTNLSPLSPLKESPDRSASEKISHLDDVESFCSNHPNIRSSFHEEKNDIPEADSTYDWYGDSYLAFGSKKALKTPASITSNKSISTLSASKLTSSSITSSNLTLTSMLP